MCILPHLVLNGLSKNKLILTQDPPSIPTNAKLSNSLSQNTITYTCGQEASDTDPQVILWKLTPALPEDPLYAHTDYA